jgi:hypothetical protein
MSDSSALISDGPIAWRTWWRHEGDWAQLGKRKRPACQQVHRSKAEADQHKTLLQAQFGARVSVCITPIYVTSGIRESRLQQRQHSFAADWPLQAKPLTR